MATALEFSALALKSVHTNQIFADESVRKVYSGGLECGCKNYLSGEGEAVSSDRGRKDGDQVGDIYSTHYPGDF
jgi:hypothetical protein